MTKNAVIMLDGASQPEPSDHDGGWYAEVLGSMLCQELSSKPDVDLPELLAAAIAAIAAQYGLQPGNSPSSTVSILRWSSHADVLVLGDSPVVALTSDGRVQQVRDDRLRHVGRSERKRLANAAGFNSDHPQRWRRLVDAERTMRNQPGGYWIAEATPDAAAHAHSAQWDLQDLAAVLLMTDGVSAGVDRYGLLTHWQEAFAVARPNPSRLVDMVHCAETDDPNGSRWRRSKRHDDKAIALVDFVDSSSSLAGRPPGRASGDQETGSAEVGPA